MSRIYFFLTLLILVAVPSKVLSHGANIEYQETTAVGIQAKYDDGTPMANAQVVIYAPSDRTTPWLKGKTDEQGKFTFVPDVDADNAGDWDIKVRQSGHGDITSIPIAGGKLAQNVTQTNVNQTNANQTKSDGAKSQVPSTVAGSGYTSAQKIVMAAAGVWGFVGTALFFSRSKSPQVPSQVD